jgi:hypothetical protein
LLLHVVEQAADARQQVDAGPGAVEEDQNSRSVVLPPLYRIPDYTYRVGPMTLFCVRTQNGPDHYRRLTVASQE